MFYYVRAALLIFALITCIILYRTLRRKNLKAYPIVVACVILACILISFNPIENLFYRFGSPAESFEYTNPQDRLIMAKEHGNSAAVLFYNTRESSPQFIIVERDSKGWMINNPNVSLGAIPFTSDRILGTYRYISPDVYFIEFSVSAIRNEPVDVRDSVNTKFDLYRSDDFYDMHFDIYYAFVTVANDYILSINGKDFYVK